MIAKADIRRVRSGWATPTSQTTMKYLHYVPRPDEARLVADAFAVDASAADLADGARDPR